MYLTDSKTRWPGISTIVSGILCLPSLVFVLSDLAIRMLHRDEELRLVELSTINVLTGLVTPFASTATIVVAAFSLTALSVPPRSRRALSSCIAFATLSLVYWYETGFYAIGR